jgi:hypothetical protein
VIVCKLCGNANPDGSTFCGDCGRFLEWAGEKVLVPQTITVIEEAPPEATEPRPKGWWRRLLKWMRNRFPSYTVKSPEHYTIKPRDQTVDAEMVPAAAAVPVGVAAGTPPPVSAAASSPPPPPPAAGPPAAAAPPSVPAPPRAAAAPRPPAAAWPPVAAAVPPPPRAAAPPPPPGPAAPPPPPRAAPPPPPPRAAAPPPPPAAAAPPPPPAVSAPPPRPAAPPPGPPRPQDPGPAAADGQSDEDAAREAATRAELAAALVNPVEGTAVMPDYDTPELPPQPVLKKVRPIVKTKPTRRLEPGDLVCAACGEGNAPTRKFCSRCGESLAEAGVVTAVWWRRFFRWVAAKLRGPPLPAGTRPGQKGTREHRRGRVRAVLRKFRVVLCAILLVVGLIYAFYAPFRSAVYDDTASLFHKVEPGYQPVQPVRVTANVQTPLYPATAAADQYTNTYWLAKWSESRIPTITFKFGSSVLLRKLILLSGAAGYFVQHGRPSILKLTFSNGGTQILTPEDTSAQQTLTLSNTEFVNSVTVQVADIYPGVGNTQDVAITEMQWFQLK